MSVAVAEHIPAELIRAHDFHHLVRDVAKDVDIGGATMKRGDRLLLQAGGANHDPAQYEDRDAIQFGHKATRRPTFGAGIPRFPGATLPRLELCVPLEQFHAGVPDYRLARGESVRGLSGQQKGVPNYVPITYGPSPER